MIFLDLKKAYDTLDRERTMAILKGYGVRDNIQNFIRKIWNEDMIVPKQAGFFGKPFRATRGVRQGDIMSPTIFNIVVDAVVNEWLEKDEKQKVEAIFFADDGLLISDDPNAAQEALSIMTENFARVGLKMNALKTEAMTIKGGKVYEAISDEAYKRRKTGTGMTHREWNLEKIECNLCGELVGRQYMTKHQQTTKCKANQEKYKQKTITETSETSHHEPQCYIINIIPGVENKCVVNNCPATTKSAGEMRKHFRNRHSEDTIIIADEGLLPQCPKCGLFQKCVDAKHQESLDCKRFAAIKEKREQAKEQARASEFIFTISGNPIKSTREFKYLGRILNEKDSDQPAIMYNLQRAREKWSRIGRILSKKGASPKTMGTFYKTIVQSVLLYGSETWTISKQMMKILRSFHRRCGRFIMGKHIWQDSNGTIYFAIREREILHRYPELLLYRRFIDDMFFIWIPKTIDDDIRFQSFQNDVNNYGKLKWKFSQLQRTINFLDLTITITAHGNITTRLYEKVENLYLYLPANSSQPPHTLKGLIAGMIYRTVRLTSTFEQQKIELQNLVRRLIARGYRQSYLVDLINKTYTSIRTKLINISADSPVQQQSGICILHLPFHPDNPPSFRIQQAFQNELLRPRRNRKL